MELVLAQYAAINVLHFVVPHTTVQESPVCIFLPSKLLSM